MASRRELESRLSRMEAKRPQKTEAELAELKMLRAMPLADLKRLEGILKRIGGDDDRLAKLTAPERVWLTELGYDVS